MPSQEHEREREREREIKHIATGTNPQPRGWTTPSSSWWPPGWWRWPPVMISPSGRVPEQGLDWFFVATEACDSGTSDLGLPSGVLEYLGIYRAKRQCGRPPRWAQRTWAHLGPQARPGGLCSPRSSPLVLLWPIGCLLVQKKSPKKFRCVWTLFGIDFLRCKKQAKNSNWHWALCQ
jgi:hypothetical protein